MWQAMMIVMMAPSVVPWVVTLSGLLSARTATSKVVYVATFLGGYFGVWLCYSTIAATAQELIRYTEMLDAGSLTGRMGGSVLLVAGLTELTSLKRHCLTTCRSPLGFLLARWRDGLRGAFEMGLRHGLYCVGCCWALMALGLVAGAMHVLWMAALTVLVTVEQVAPGGDRVAKLAGVGLALAGMAILATV
jgi:predicted metal-binding membrane protein